MRYVKEIYIVPNGVLAWKMEEYNLTHKSHFWIIRGIVQILSIRWNWVEAAFPERTWVCLIQGNKNLDAECRSGIRIRDTDLREIRVKVWSDVERTKQKVSKG